jgi:hypothetical protein
VLASFRQDRGTVSDLRSEIDPVRIDPVRIDRLRANFPNGPARPIDQRLEIAETTSKTDVTTSREIVVVTSVTVRTGSIAVINTWTIAPDASTTAKSGATTDTSAAITCTIT